MRALGAVAALMSVAACQAPPAEMTEAETTQIQAEVLQLAEAWNDAWKDIENDCETTADLFHPEYFAFFWQGRRIGRTEWADYCNSSTATRAGYSGDWTDTEVRVLSPDAAVFIGSYDRTVWYNDGSPARHSPTAGQVILAERTATGWGITSFNSFLGPSEMVEEG